MADIIEGKVTEVVDGDTFRIDMTFEDEDNDYEYNTKEKIRIGGIDAPELEEPGGERSKEDLENAIDGENVRCTVYARDKYGRLVADVEIA